MSERNAMRRTASNLAFYLEQEGITGAAEWARDLEMYLRAPPEEEPGRVDGCEQCGGPQVHTTLCPKCDPDRCSTCGGDGSVREDG